jgi:glucose-6-phosphate 1-epimerase
MSSHIVEHGELRKLVINHPAAKAELFLHGAHLTSWTPTGQKPVIYLSPKSQFTANKPIRGGVPVCFPWFAANPADVTLPMHGYARLVEWKLADVSETPEQANVHFQLTSHHAPAGMPKADFVADLRFSIGRELTMKLTVHNTGTTPFSFEEALHTYYAVSDVRNVNVAGLQGASYLSRAEGNQLKTDSAPAIQFAGETDRAYFNTESTCTIDDPGFGRKIVVEKSGSRSTVVWNPFPKRATELTDIGAENWPGFVCVETANVMDNRITLPAGQTHEMTAHVKVMPR